MKPHRTIAVAAGALALAALSQPAAAAIALEGAIYQQATSNIGAGPAVTVQAMNSWAAGSPEDLVALASATAVQGSNRVVTRSKMTAAWASADEGTIDVVDHGWTFTGVTGDEVDAEAYAYAPADKPDWTYTFTATADSVFELDFNLLGNGALAGLGYWYVSFGDIAGPADTTALATGFAPNSPLTGHYARNLTAGQTYRVALRNDESYGLTLPLDVPVAGKETGRFNWRIVTEGGSAVPEPASWALMIGGFGLAGASFRRRRALAAAA
jgi:hypothetical protein